jgi:signal transduction histidine kinase/DNA-binding response OmpR family regulator
MKMKKNNAVLVLSCMFSLAFLYFVVHTTQNLGSVENILAKSPNVQDVTDQIETKILVTKEEINSDWMKADFEDDKWKPIKIPKDWVPKEPEFKEGNFTYYRIRLPKESISKISHLQNESILAFYYVLFSKVDVYVNGVYQGTNKPTNYNESILNVPIDESKENVIALKGYIKTGDSGINHRGKIFAGKEAELNELHRKSYKGQTVFSLIFILCKGSILFIFTLIFLMMKVEKFFEKSLMYGMFVLFEDVLTGDYVTHIFNLNQQVYLYNVANIGVIVFLFLFMSDVIQLRYSKKLIAVIVGSLFVASFLVAFDVLYTSYAFTIDDFLKFWNAMMIVVLLNFIPRVFKTDKISFFVLSIAALLTGYSAFFSSNVGHNLKELSGLLIFFMVAYQTFILFRRQQNQLIEQEKDVAIGKIAAILAHDVRRPLDQMSLILNRIMANDATEDFLKIARQDIEFSITSVNNQISDIMNFSRTKEIDLGPISFYNVLLGSLKQAMSINSNVQIQILYDFKLSQMILGEESRLSSAITNIVVNAIEAIRDIGKRDKGIIRISINEESKYLVCKIANDGPIIPPLLIEEIFKPLFTNGKSRGTGLGLASVAKIVRDHKGTITVQNIGGMVEFSLKFLLAEKKDTFTLEDFKKTSREYSYHEEANEVEKQGSLRILLLDDDKYVYEYLKDLARKTKYELEIIFANDYNDAAKLVKSKGFDLYILDFDLGSNQTGVDFFNEYLSELNANVLLHTGREEITLIKDLVQHVRKPIGLKDLNKVLENANTKRLRVLLVEDSKLIGVAWKMYHGSNNIRVVCSPEEALGILEKDSNFYDVCVLDHYFDNSPMTGLILADKISAIDVRLKILLMTSSDVETKKFVKINKSDYEIRKFI